MANLWHKKFSLMLEQQILRQNDLEKKIKAQKYFFKYTLKIKITNLLSAIFLCFILTKTNQMKKNGLWHCFTNEWLVFILRF